MAAAFIDIHTTTRTRTGTRVRVAPYLLQGVRVLSMPLCDLGSFALEASESNPLLSVDYESPAFKLEELPGEATFRGPASQPEGRRAPSSCADDPAGWDFSRIGDGSSDLDTLHEHLRLQAADEPLSPIQRAVMDALIEAVSDEGYFTGSFADISDECGVPVEEVERLLKALQGFDPAGVGARTIAECLWLQARRSDEGLSDAALAMIRDDLEALAANKTSELARKYGVPRPEVVRTREAVQGLAPRPGDSFLQKERLCFTNPDVVVRDDGGCLTAEVVGADQPCLRLDADYVEILKAKGLRSDAKAYLDEQLRSAQVVLRNLDQRHRTLQMLSAYLLKRQYRYFVTEGQCLEPMTMRSVAADLGVNTSTVSRAVRDKYLRAPWGSVPLKALFSSRIECGNPAVAVAPTSSFDVKRIVKSLVSDEDPSRPLSDSQITCELNRMGFKIKRRTVAKYRNELGIGTQSTRRWTRVAAS